MNIWRVVYWLVRDNNRAFRGSVAAIVLGWMLATGVYLVPLPSGKNLGLLRLSEAASLSTFLPRVLSSFTVIDLIACGTLTIVAVFWILPLVSIVRLGNEQRTERRASSRGWVSVSSRRVDDFEVRKVR